MQRRTGETQFTREKLRCEINRHIEEFLNNGGAIVTIVNQPQSPQGAGSVWSEAIPADLDY